MNASLFSIWHRAVTETMERIFKMSNETNAKSTSCFASTEKESTYLPTHTYSQFTQSRKALNFEKPQILKSSMNKTKIHSTSKTDDSSTNIWAISKTGFKIVTTNRDTPSMNTARRCQLKFEALTVVRFQWQCELFFTETGLIYLLNTSWAPHDFSSAAVHTHSRLCERPCGFNKTLSGQKCLS